MHDGQNTAEDLQRQLTMVRKKEDMLKQNIFELTNDLEKLREADGNGSFISKFSEAARKVFDLYTAKYPEQKPQSSDPIKVDESAADSAQPVKPGINPGQQRRNPFSCLWRVCLGAAAKRCQSNTSDAATALSVSGEHNAAAGPCVSILS